MKKVALVLASGGSRGLAHIGAIDELQSRGYRITSVSGTSMGALVGGIYVAGGLDAFREWMFKVDKIKILSMMDFTISTDGLVKGERIIKELKKLVPDVNIEDLEIPFSAVATDIKGMKEVVFDKGSMFDAIRSSISLPSLFKPFIIGDMVLIDGGVVNPIPLDRVRRTSGDIMVAVDLNAPYEDKKHGTGKSNKKFSMNYYTILSESSALTIQANSERSIALCKPDILVRIPKNAYTTLEFYKYGEIVERGRMEMAAALDLYETKARLPEK